MWWAFATALAAPSLSVDALTWELGGRATADFYAGGAEDFSVTLYPRLGVFVSRHVELIGGVGVFLHDGGSSTAFFAGFEYLFSGGAVRPYLGGTLGYGAVDFPHEPDLGDVTAASFLLGIVVPCSRKVGVDLGGRVNLYLYEPEAVVHVPIGYLGVRAFFP